MALIDACLCGTSVNAESNLNRHGVARELILLSRCRREMGCVFVDDGGLLTTNEGFLSLEELQLAA